MTGQRSNTVVVSHLAFGTLSLWSIYAPRWRRSWNVWISCSQDGRQGSQHLIRFSVGHFALAQGNPGGYRTGSRRTKKFCAPDHSKHSSTSGLLTQESNATKILSICWTRRGAAWALVVRLQVGAHLSLEMEKMGQRPRDDGFCGTW
jgi:hypothetical protein